MRGLDYRIVGYGAENEGAIEEVGRIQGENRALFRSCIYVRNYMFNYHCSSLYKWMRIARSCAYGKTLSEMSLWFSVFFERRT